MRSYRNPWSHSCILLNKRIIFLFCFVLGFVCFNFLYETFQFNCSILHWHFDLIFHSDQFECDFFYGIFTFRQTKQKPNSEVNFGSIDNTHFWHYKKSSFVQLQQRNELYGLLTLTKILHALIDCQINNREENGL